MLKVGLVGWRGMVGSVLLQRMHDEQDFRDVEPTFFSTSQVGIEGPAVNGKPSGTLQDAFDTARLAAQDVIITCQGSDYTNAVHDDLRARGWQGYWIDAASTMRMRDAAAIVLDPVNRALIERRLDQGCRTFVGGNCTVSLMLMGLGGVLQRGWVEWMSSMTYQAASGAGARHMTELLKQMGYVHEAVATDLKDPAQRILDIDCQVTSALRDAAMPTEQLGYPLAGSLLPWIDIPLENGQSREEWKGGVETNKILGLAPHTVPVDGICVRIGTMRCHAQAFTVKLKQDIPMADIEAAIREHTPWTKLVPNEKDATLQQLTPTAVAGTLTVPVGRVRKMSMGGEYLSAFSVGDQLLWGAAEPLRRMLRIIAERH